MRVEMRLCRNALGHSLNIELDSDFQQLERS